MPTLLLALLFSALAALGARPARLVAQLSARLGRSGGLLAVGWLTAAAASALAAWLGGLVEPVLTEEGKTMFVAAALAVAAIELAWPMRREPPAEPTRSLGAMTLVLGTGQAVDAARFLVLALAVATGDALLAGVGGTLGSGAVLTLAWTLGARWEARLPLAAIRLALAGLLIIAALVVWA